MKLTFIFFLPILFFTQTGAAELPGTTESTPRKLNVAFRADPTGSSQELVAQNSMDEILRAKPAPSQIQYTKDTFFAELRRLMLGTSSGADENLASSIPQANSFLRNKALSWWPALDASYHMDCAQPFIVLRLAAHPLGLTFSGDEVSKGATRNLLQSGFQNVVESGNCSNTNAVKKFLGDVMALAESVKSERISQISANRERQAAESSSMQQAKADYGRQLKSGAVKVNNIDDAALLLDAASGLIVVISPNQSPDRRPYKINGVLTRWDGSMLTGRVGESIFAVLVGSETKYLNNAKDRLRMNGSFTVVGNFVDTASTTSNKMAPVFAARYISAP